MAYEIKKEMISFIYAPNEDRSYPCRHEVTNPMSGDWTVKCPYYNDVKEFSVHLVVRKYSKNTKPQSAYEILYWVTNRRPNSGGREFTGSSFMLSLEEKSYPNTFKMGQMVDNGFAHLDLKIKLL
jgi:hypothetical protein